MTTSALTAPGGTRAVLVSRAVLIALGVAFVVSVALGSGSGAAVGRLGGDFPAFYAAGKMVTAGDGDRLYDPERQVAAQQPYFGDERDGGYLPFAYPPAVALAYAPLAELPYRASYVVQVGLMVGALLLALILLRPQLGSRRADATVVAAVAIGFFPMFRSITAGQNTAFALLLVAVAWRAVDDERPLLGGVALGLLLYKPQYAIAFLLLALVGRRWRVLAGAALGAAMVWSASAATAGVGWTGSWWSHARRFAEADSEIDRANAISWSGLAHAVLGGGVVGDLVGAVLIAATAGALLWAALRSSRATDAAIGVAVAAPAALLMAPHALFYDAGLLVLTAAVMSARLGRRGRQLVGVVWLVSLGHVAADAIGVTPVAVGVVALGAASLVVAGRPARGGLVGVGER